MNEANYCNRCKRKAALNYCSGDAKTGWQIQHKCQDCNRYWWENRAA